MKNRQKKVLQFPKPPEEPQTILCQIGNERFAIHYEIEDLAPLSLPLLPKRETQKTMAKIVKWPRVTGPSE